LLQQALNTTLVIAVDQVSDQRLSFKFKFSHTSAILLLEIFRRCNFTHCLHLSDLHVDLVELEIRVLGLGVLDLSINLLDFPCVDEETA
jgi:hypothetical protein